VKNEVVLPLNERLKQMRLSRGYSVKEFAKAIEIPESTYREWEYGRGLRVPPFEKIAELLTISVTEVVTGLPSNLHDIERELANLAASLDGIRAQLSMRT
jgi:transcriptional regulator with XRE-family HTH domain